MNREDISSTAVRSTAVVAGATYVNQILSFAANVVLMRLIVPEHFGTVALGLFFLTLCRKVFGLGVNSALVHKQDDLERAYGVHLTLNLIIAGLTLLVVAMVSPLIGAHYDRSVVVALWAFALAGLVEGTAHTPRLALEKSFRFKGLMAVRVTDTLAINAIAIIVAAMGFGLWALILRFVLSAVYEAVCMWWISPVKMRPGWDWPLARWFIGFGGHLWLGGLATFVIYQLDDWFVGTLIGATVLGYYNRAYNLSLLPTSMVSQVAGKVAFPVYARLQQDRRALSSAFAATMRGVSMLTFPFSVLLFLVAPELVQILFGDRWMPMVPLLRALILFSGARPVFDNTGDLFAAVGQPRTGSRIMVGQAAALAMILWPCMRVGDLVASGIQGADTDLGRAVGAALAVGVVMLGGVVTAYTLLRRHVDVEYRNVFLGPALASGLALVLSLFIVSYLGVQGSWAIGSLKALSFCVLFVVSILSMEGSRIRRDLYVLRRLIKGEAVDGKDA